MSNTFEFDEGVIAAERGKSRSENPYEYGSDESNDWFDGFDYKTEILNQGSK